MRARETPWRRYGFRPIRRIGAARAVERRSCADVCPSGVPQNQLYQRDDRGCLRDHQADDPFQHLGFQFRKIGFGGEPELFYICFGSQTKLFYIRFSGEPELFYISFGSEAELFYIRFSGEAELFYIGFGGDLREIEIPTLAQDLSDCLGHRLGRSRFLETPCGAQRVKRARHFPFVSADRWRLTRHHAQYANARLRLRQLRSPPFPVSPVPTRHVLEPVNETESKNQQTTNTPTRQELSFAVVGNTRRHRCLSSAVSAGDNIGLG